MANMLEWKRADLNNTDTAKGQMQVRIQIQTETKLSTDRLL